MRATDRMQSPTGVRGSYTSHNAIVNAQMRLISKRHSHAYNKFIT